MAQNDTTLPATVSKSEFARLVQVSSARVSQWIGAGRISGAGLVGDGRHQRIVVNVALGQLKRRLDPSQRASNGTATRFNFTPAPAEAAAIDEIDERMRRALLEERESRATIAKIEAERATGNLLSRDDVVNAVTELGAIAVARIELMASSSNAEALLAAANAVGAPEILKVLKKLVRELRSDVADAYEKIPAHASSPGAADRRDADDSEPYSD